MSCSSKTGNLRPVLPLFGAAIIGVALLTGPGAAQAGDAASCTFTPTKPTPAPGPSTINLPADQAARPVDVEWWFLIGTVKSGDRSFGVEINIARFGDVISQTYVKIADVAGGRNYAEVINYPASALKTSTTEFSATLPTATMSGPLDNMKASGKLPDGTIDLTLSQKGPPLVVFGTGRADLGGFVSNYYALTNIAAKGTLSFNGQSFDVIGLLWMDHQYGGWGSHVTWGWTGTQLDNGVSIMAFTSAPICRRQAATGCRNDSHAGRHGVFRAGHHDAAQSDLDEPEFGECLFHPVDARHSRPQRLPHHHQLARRAGIPHRAGRQARQRLGLRGGQHRERDLGRQAHRRPILERTGALSTLGIGCIEVVTLPNSLSPSARQIRPSRRGARKGEGWRRECGDELSPAN